VSRFVDHLGLELIEDANGRPVLTRDGRCQWRLLSQLTYDVGADGSGETIRVPADATTDLASIPRVFWSLLPPDGPWLKAAVVHDRLYRTQGLRGRYDRAQSDGILREAMGVVGVPAWKRQVIWAAVRVGGGGGWGR
jgi:hypothetical protein